MGELRTRATMDDKPFRAGLDRMDKSVKGFNSRISQVKGIIGGAFAIGGLTAFARSVVDLGSKISDLATQTGTSTSDIQTLSYAIREAGGRQEDLLPVLSKVQSSIGRIARGEAQELVKAFDELGISSDELIQLSVPQALERIGEGYIKANRSAMAFSAVAQIIGEDQGPKVIEVLERLGKDGLGTVYAEGVKAHQVMSEDVIPALDEASDALERWKTSAKVSGAETVGWWQTTKEDLAILREAMATGQNAYELEAKLEELKSAEVEQDKERLKLQKERNTALSVERARIKAIQDAEDERAKEAEKDWQSYKQFVAAYERLLGLNEKVQKIESPEAPTRQVDQLTRIGGMLGGRGNNDMSRLIQEQQRIRSHVAAIQRDVERQKRVTIAEP